MDLEERRQRAENGSMDEKLLYAFALEHKERMSAAQNVYASLLKEGFVGDLRVFYGGVRCGLPLIEGNPVNNAGFVRLYNVLFGDGTHMVDWGLECVRRDALYISPVLEYVASGVMLQKAEVLGVQKDLVERVWGLFGEDLGAKAVAILRGNEGEHVENAFVSLLSAPVVRSVKVQ